MVCVRNYRCRRGHKVDGLFFNYFFSSQKRVNVQFTFTLSHILQLYVYVTLNFRRKKIMNNNNSNNNKYVCWPTVSPFRLYYFQKYNRLFYRNARCSVPSSKRPLHTNIIIHKPSNYTLLYHSGQNWFFFYSNV